MYMKEKDKLTTIDNYIKLNRKIMDALTSLSSEEFKEKVQKIFNLSSFDEYNFILDAFYLLEDTQLSKRSFETFGLKGPSNNEGFGERYLRMYGIMNACYLQKEALLQIIKKTNSKINEKRIHKLEIFNYRKIFASHTTNVNHNKCQKSYILNRFALKNDRLEGYSSTNENANIETKNASIEDLINEWNILLIEELNKFTTELCLKECFKYVPSEVEYKNKLKLIQKIEKGEVYCSNLWDNTHL